MTTTPPLPVLENVEPRVVFLRFCAQPNLNSFFFGGGAFLGPTEIIFLHASNIHIYVDKTKDTLTSTPNPPPPDCRLAAVQEKHYADP